jgi:hypothetical protein
MQNQIAQDTEPQDGQITEGELYSGESREQPADETSRGIPLRQADQAVGTRSSEQVGNSSNHYGRYLYHSSLPFVPKTNRFVEMTL